MLLLIQGRPGLSLMKYLQTIYRNVDCQHKQWCENSLNFKEKNLFHHFLARTKNTYFLYPIHTIGFIPHGSLRLGKRPCPSTSVGGVYVTL